MIIVTIFYLSFIIYFHQFYILCLIGLIINKKDLIYNKKYDDDKITN